MSEHHDVATELERLVAPRFGGELPVRLVAWDGSSAGPSGAPTVLLHSPAALRRLLYRPGELGVAQAYVTGELDVEGDLLDGLRRIWQRARGGAVRRRASLGDLARTARALRAGRALGAVGRPPPPPASQARLRGRLHTAWRDRQAVAHHYDLSNDFYELILDPTMAYSCAYFPDDRTTLDEAQLAKLDLVCAKLGLGEGARLLDIGCGWGSLTLHAAERHGASVVGITLSEQQRRFVQRRIEQRGLADRVEVRRQDYREVLQGGEAPFDAVSSVEMGEHVGRRNYPAFVATIHAALAPGGRALIQQMSRRTHPGGGPFIEAFIAPDMHMQPVGETVELLEHGGLEVRDVHAMREHYVRTVSAWYGTFEKRIDEVVALVGEEVARVWRLYLVGGALSFEEGRMGVDQILAVRATGDGRSGLPPRRTA